MSRAYKCDMTGKVEVGEGVRQFQAQLTSELRLEIVPMVKVAPMRYEQAELCPMAVAKIQAALAGLQDAGADSANQPAPGDAG